MATRTDTGACAPALSPGEEERTREAEEQRTLVCAAVALGWQMAELFHSDHEEKAPAEQSPTDRPDLPGVGKLQHEERQELRIAQLSRGLALLSSATKDEQLARLNDELHEVTKSGGVPHDLDRLHVKLLSALTVANFRLGKAYGLGRALFETCWEMPAGDTANPDDTAKYHQALGHHLGEKHLAKLIAWCLDLKSVLPDHAGQAVAGSLERWRSWGRQKPWTSIEPADFSRRLRRQGERWRAILTGEKDARDLLTTTTYINAGEELISDAAEVTLGFVKRFWALVALMAVLLFGGLAAILLANKNGAIAGLVSVATALGLSWKTVSPTLSRLSGKLSGPLWEAELDAAITDAVTEPMVPATSVTPPSADQPVPVGHATDARITREAAREVWKRLDRATRTRATVGRQPLVRLGYRYAGLWRGKAQAPFLPHDAYLTHVQSGLEARLASKELEAGGKSRDELFAQFGPNDWEWIKTVVQGGLTAIEGKSKFGLDPCEQQMGDRTRIVLFSDWATGMPRAQALAEQIKEALEEPDEPCERHLIHLGDVYYCGEHDEYQRRFLKYWPAFAEESESEVDVQSWNLNGNHDMYSGGRGYFELISPKAGGPDDPRQEAFAHQNGTSFFRIFNEHWQIVGLDTAYVDNDLDERQLPKLREWLEPPKGNPERGQATGRRTILLSHHQLGSSRAQASVSPGIRKKTAALRKEGLIHAWFWGHEHRAFVYEEYLKVKFPVCIGNGGVPELLSHVFTFSGAFQAVVDFTRKVRAFLTPKRWTPAPKVKFKPKTPRLDDQNLKWEKLGFIVIDLDGNQGTAVYHGEDGELHEIDSFGR